MFLRLFVFFLHLVFVFLSFLLMDQDHCLPSLWISNLQKNYMAQLSILNQKEYLLKVYVSQMYYKEFKSETLMYRKEVLEIVWSLIIKLDYPAVLWRKPKCSRSKRKVQFFFLIRHLSSGRISHWRYCSADKVLTRG